ncbi:MAG: bifunctional fucokinase/L-fucose-1-P-guanylyltransferase [Ignavibacteriae bacterium]|nr:bifunctional fucokinase/L-fucose-1-P-guanylyltransferase [Ignavibacteriota bacterium]
MKYILSLPPNLVDTFHRLECKDTRHWFVTSDPNGTRIGSGGGTSHALSECWRRDVAGGGADAPANVGGSGALADWLAKEKKIIIHAGGLSRRLPSYAPSGKILTPLPVFRWSRGQSLQQKLLDLQLPLFEKIMGSAPDRSNTLITSGDVLIWNEGPIPDIPSADVVCFGIWTEPAKATHHGVFFLERSQSGNLAFMLQKPSTEKIIELSNRYDELIDIGVWLLSDRAVQVLMKKCGWRDEAGTYAKGVAGYYDLYSDFGLGLGSLPAKEDAELNALTTAVVALDKGEFYHFGTTNEVIESSVALQNRVLNQRAIWHRKIKPHPAIFVLNAKTDVPFTADHQYLWIENSHISKDWKLGKNQMITGVPENAWALEVPDSICLDIIPIGPDAYCVRPFGYTDTFKGDVGRPETAWMGRPCGHWFAARGLARSGFAPDGTDIQFARIFPVVGRDALTGSFVQWMIGGGSNEDAESKATYLGAAKLSATEIGNAADLLRLQEQRSLYCSITIPLIAQNHEYSIFYQLDLDKLADDYHAFGITLPPDLGSDAPLMKRIHSYMFKARVADLRKEDGRAYEQKAFALLKDSIISTCVQNSASPRLTLIRDQIIWGRSPVRIDLAGGWTDTPPYCLINGGRVVNIALNLNGQPPIQCFIKPSAAPKIILRSIDLGVEEIISTYDQLRHFHKVGSPFSIAKAALSLAGFTPEFSGTPYASLEAQLEHFGGGLEITTLAAVPKGSGLGTSSILAATVLGTLAETCDLNWDNAKVSQMTLVLEQLLTTGGGWQDQLGGIMQGIKIIETKPGLEQLPVIRWLPNQLFTDVEYKSSMLLYYTGITRVAKNILAEIVRGMFLNSGRKIGLLEEIGDHAADTFDVIQRGDYRHLGRQIEKSWQLNNKLDAGTNTPEIQRMLERVAPYVIGKKLAGAGGGGFMLMLARDSDATKRIREILNAEPLNANARFVDFQLSETGLQISRS